jgi:tellurite resistance-related uncharacterized protein
MKKFLLTILMFFSVVALVACDKKPVEPDPDPDPDPQVTDTVKPVITVPGATIELYVGDQFDPMLNVTAQDDKDGNITSSITYTSSPALDLNTPGRYTITYKVKDKAGNEATKDVLVIVQARPQGLGIQNADFDEWDAERGMPVGWTKWVNESQDVAATFSHGESMAIVDITAQSVVKDNNWWDVQFRCETMTFPAFESYTLRIWAYAENPRYMMVNIQDGGLAQKAIDAKLVELGTTVPTEPIEIDFFGLQDANNALLQFNLGTFHKVADTHPDKQTVLGKVYFMKVEVVSGPEIENQAPLLQGKDILVPIGGPALIKQGITVRDDRDNLTLDDVTATALGAELDVNTPGVYEYEYSVTDSEGLTTTMRRKFIVGSFVIPTMDKWTQFVEAGKAAQVVTAPAGSTEAQIEVTQLGDRAWHNQFKLTGLMGTKGTYRIKFTASSSVARTIVFALEQNYGVGVPRVWHRLELTPEPQVFKFDLTLPETATSPGQFQFFMGDASHDTAFADGVYVPSVITIKDFSVREVLPEAGLKNGNFAQWDDVNGVPTGWTKWVNESQDVAATYSQVDGKAVIDITAQSVVKDNNWWDVQLKYPSLVFDAYESYTLKIWAYADSPRYMRINLGGGGLPERPINELQVELGNTVPTEPISINFFGKGDAVNAALTFHLGTFHKVAGTTPEMQTVLGKVYFVKVEIVEGPALVNQAPTLQGGPVITDVGVPIDIKAGIKVQDDMDVMKLADVVATPVEAELDINTPGIYPYKYVATDSEGLTAELVRNIYVGSFFIPTMDKWTQWSGDGGTQVVTAAAGSTEASIEVSVLGPNAWHNQFKLTKTFAKAGTYQIKFTASSTVARTIVFALEQNYGVGVPRVWHRVDLTDTEAEFTFELVLPEDAKDVGQFQFFLGNAAHEAGFEDGVYVPSTIVIKNFTVTKIA